MMKDEFQGVPVERPLFSLIALQYAFGRVSDSKALLSQKKTIKIILIALDKDIKNNQFSFNDKLSQL